MSNLRQKLMGKAPRCKARSSRTGQPCKRWAIAGGVICPTHGGQSPQVKKAAAKRVADILADAIDPQRVMREAARLAYSDIRQLFDEAGNFLPIQKWPDDIARAVSSVEVVKKNVTTGDGKVDDVLKVRLWDKPGKVQDLMKHHGLLVEKVELSGDAELLSRLDAWKQKNAKAKL